MSSTWSREGSISWFISSLFQPAFTIPPTWCWTGWAEVGFGGRLTFPV